ncbi:tha9 protein [Panicum miliaceum]|uniref:Tha9 protein n=1 Tax=Panicum miliaceum TaxID=4540 RepID=A0A3L6S8F8_PANMI|nr:tha9 protein [Panicum miliaceum]
MGIAVVAPVAAASSYLGAPPRAAAAAGRAPARAHVAAAGMSSRASSFVGCGLAVAAASIAARPRRTGSGGGGALGCKCLFGLGVPELAVIAGVAALVFGPKQLPEIGRNIGKTVKSFQQAAKEFETELKKEPGEGGDEPPPATPTAVGDGEEKRGA